MKLTRIAAMFSLVPFVVVNSKGEEIATVNADGSIEKLASNFQAMTGEWSAMAAIKAISIAAQG